MIGIFDNSGARLAQTYNGLTLNNPADAADNTYEINVVSIHPQLDTIEDPNPDDDGTEMYRSRKIRLVASISGTIRAQSIGALFDKMVALIAAFDPAKASHENPATQGFLTYDFTTPATTPLACRYYARTRTLWVPPISEYTGLAAFFNLELEMRDPRRYAQAASSLTGAGTATNAGDYRTWPGTQVTMAGAGSATYTLTRTGTGLAATTKALVLDLSSCIAGDVVGITMATKRIERTRAGITTDVPSLYASGDFFELEPGNQTVTPSNTTNATTVTNWRSAWCV